MHALDWIIVAAMMVALLAIAMASRYLMRSVADFMAAGRHVGRYLLSISFEVASIGAVSVVAMFEQFYETGFVSAYWYLLWWFVSLVIALSGWVTYRFRETRALTMAQFFEMRYSRRFRIFAGMLAFGAGIVNFGIFPAVGVRFFIYFCGLPSHFVVGPVEVSSFVALMVLLISIALFFTFVGGQVAVTLTGFLQGILFSFGLLLIVGVLMRTMTWSQITATLSAAPPDASLVNPFQTSEIENFNMWFFLIGAFALVYHHMAWQGNQGYFCAARNPHEARMGRILFIWRQFIEKLLIILLPVCVYTLLHHPAFADQAARTHDALRSIENPQIVQQMTVPLGLRELLPRGVMGALCAMMMAAFVTTHDTYLHSWGSIFVQDVVLPLRGKPLSPKRHILLLRLSICGVAVFVFCFSLLFRQTEQIYMFFAITGAIYLGGAGSVIVGGLYWKRGTAEAAWSSMIVGSSLASLSIIIKQIELTGIPFDFLRQFAERVAAVNGQLLFGVAMACSIGTYIAVSLLGPRRVVDLNRILNRGPYAIADDRVHAVRRSDRVPRWQRVLGMGEEFTRLDKGIYIATIVWTTVWILSFLTVTLWGLLAPFSDETWCRIWYGCTWMAYTVGAVTFVWFLIGGLVDVRALLRHLRTAARDDSDDGTVRIREATPNEVGQAATPEV